MENLQCVTRDTVTRYGSNFKRLWFRDTGNNRLPLMAA